MFAKILNVNIDIYTLELDKIYRTFNLKMKNVVI